MSDNQRKFMAMTYAQFKLFMAEPAAQDWPYLSKEGKDEVINEYFNKKRKA